MLEAVQLICAARSVPLQISLEALMACGVGACLGCVVKGAGHSELSPRYLCSCKEGPVFRSEQLDWSRLGEEAGRLFDESWTLSPRSSFSTSSSSMKNAV